MGIQECSRISAAVCGDRGMFQDVFRVLTPLWLTGRISASGAVAMGPQGHPGGVVVAVGGLVAQRSIYMLAFLKDLATQNPCARCHIEIEIADQTLSHPVTAYSHRANQVYDTRRVVLNYQF